MTKLELPDGMGPAEALRGLADDLLAPNAKLRAFVDFGKEGRWDSGPLEGATHGGFLRLVADLIDRKTTRNPADDVTMSAYDLLPEEDRKAIAWVRENGGFEEVKDYYECGRRIEPWNEQKADLYELMNECGGVEEIKKRLMPAGMEWPRFENGEPVKPGCEFADGLKGVRTCTSVEILACEDGVRDALVHWDGDDPDNALLVCMASGERVKRPAPKILAADRKPLREGETVWGTDGGSYHLVSAHDGEVFARHVGGSFGEEVESAGGEGLYRLRADKLTHQRPVLDADGVPIREGDTVWDTTRGRERTVKGLVKDRGEFCVMLHGFDPGYDYMRPTDLTHTKPEQDSWEKVEKDAGKNPFDYCKDVGHRLDTCENSEAYKARDLVRRAKKLSGVS